MSIFGGLFQSFIDLHSSIGEYYWGRVFLALRAPQ
jgi:hypothetical protein